MADDSFTLGPRTAADNSDGSAGSLPTQVAGPGSALSPAKSAVVGQSMQDGIESSEVSTSSVRSRTSRGGGGRGFNLVVPTNEGDMSLGSSDKTVVRQREERVPIEEEIRSTEVAAESAGAEVQVRQQTGLQSVIDPGYSPVKEDPFPTVGKVTIYSGHMSTKISIQGVYQTDDEMTLSFFSPIDAETTFEPPRGEVVEVEFKDSHINQEELPVGIERNTKFKLFCTGIYFDSPLSRSRVSIFIKVPDDD